MKDTGFSVPAASLDRLATSYWPDPASGKLVVYDQAMGSQWSRPPAFPSGAGGLVSTIDDYLAFGQMMLSQGKQPRLGIRRLCGHQARRHRVGTWSLRLGWRHGHLLVF
jgi:CubicO group peptidase (beta-lactamase class C family)